MVQKWAYTPVRSVEGLSLNHGEKSITDNKLRMVTTRYLPQSRGIWSWNLSKHHSWGCSKAWWQLSSESCISAWPRKRNLVYYLYELFEKSYREGSSDRNHHWDAKMVCSSGQQRGSAERKMAACGCCMPGPQTRTDGVETVLPQALHNWGSV